LQSEVAAKEQQLVEYQEKMEELSQKHEAALNEGNSLKEQMKHLEKLVVNNCHHNL